MGQKMIRQIYISNFFATTLGLKIYNSNPINCGSP